MIEEPKKHWCGAQYKMPEGGYLGCQLEWKHAGDHDYNPALAPKPNPTCAEENVLLRTRLALAEKVGASCLKAVDDEPEFPGEPPDELMHWLRSGPKPDEFLVAMKLSVRMTKDGIRDRIAALALLSAGEVEL